MSKILTLDIETKPALVYTWGLNNVNIGIDQIVDPGGVLCVGAKWYHEKNPMFFSSWHMGQEQMIKVIHDLLTEADAVVSFNGISFDLPRLNGEFVLQNLSPVPPLTNIDLLKVVRKLGFISKRLGFVAPHLNVGEKIPHEGFPLWTKVLQGDVDAQQRMMEYCLQDVIVTDSLYTKLRPYIYDHPVLEDKEESDACSNCGGTHLQQRGYRRTRHYKTQRLQCQSCGSWQSGTRKKI